MQRVVVGLFLVFITFFYVAGCKPNHRVVYEKFEISPVGDVSEKKIICRLSLDGTAKYAGKDKNTGMDLSHVGSPYTVFVSFYFPKEQTGIVRLKELSFFADDTLIKHVEVNREEEFDNKTEFRRGGVPQVKEENESRASFLVKQVAIPHSELTLLVTVIISTDKGDIQKILKFKLTPFEEEELRNDQRDSIMSV